MLRQLLTKQLPRLKPHDLPPQLKDNLNTLEPTTFSFR